MGDIMSKNKSVEEFFQQPLIKVFKDSGTRLSSLGETKGVMQILVKCSMEIGEKLDSTSKEIRKFNSSTSSLTKVLIFLNIVLATATVVSALAAYYK